MAFEHREVALAARHGDHIDVARPFEAGGGDEFELQGHDLYPKAPSIQGRGWGGVCRPCARPMAPTPLDYRPGWRRTKSLCPSTEGEGLGFSYAASSASFAALATASSMPPTN